MNWGIKIKKIMSRKRHASARNGRYNPAGPGRAWGWQNEAKTKPFCDAAGAVIGRAGLVKRLCLQGKAAFQPVLRRKVRHGGKLQNEAICQGIRRRQGYGGQVHLRQPGSRSGETRKYKRLTTGSGSRLGLAVRRIPCISSICQIRCLTNVMQQTKLGVRFAITFAFILI